MCICDEKININVNSASDIIIMYMLSELGFLSLR